MRHGALTGSLSACLPPHTEQEALLLFVTMCLGFNTHSGGGGERGEEMLSYYTATLESNSFSLSPCECVQHLEFVLLCEKHMRLRGDLYARGAMGNCLLRDAALMSSLHVSLMSLGEERGGMESGGLCRVNGMTVTGPAWLFNPHLFASIPVFQRYDGRRWCVLFVLNRSHSWAEGVL